MQLSSRNRLPGVITDIVKDTVCAKITLKSGDNHMVSLITRESCEELGLEVGQTVTALIKSTDVMVLTADNQLA